MLLSDARHSTERTAKIVQEISQAAHDPEVKEALEAGALISEQDLAKLDRAFKLIGQEPVKLGGRLH